MQPNLEAMTRLRYASILFQETENFMEAEEALSKGVFSLLGGPKSSIANYWKISLSDRVSVSQNASSSKLKSVVSTT